MTARDRQASGGVSLAARPAAASARAGSPSGNGERELLLWEDLFSILPPAGQEELLALAARQGLLYAHQLPPVDPSVLLQRRQFLAHLLAGKAGELSAVTASPVACLDGELDAAQREAVARALATPDVCLIQGLPGSGKSRVAAEIVTQAAARGERVLLLASTPAALDRVLEQAGRRDAVCPIRCLQPSETPESLLADVRPFAFEERARTLRDTSVQAARAATGRALQKRDARRGEGQTWEHLAALADLSEKLVARRITLEGRREKLPEEVNAAWEAGDPADAFGG